MDANITQAGRKAPNTSSLSPQSSSTKSHSWKPQRQNYKTKMCDFYEKNGECRNGNNCTYAHSIEELQNANSQKGRSQSGGPTTTNRASACYTHNKPSKRRDPHGRPDYITMLINFNKKNILDGNMVKYQ